MADVQTEDERDREMADVQTEDERETERWLMYRQRMREK